MSDLQSRLLGCFTVVFPKLQETEIQNSSVDSVTDWDSLASVTLYSLIEEEFDVELNLEDLDDLLSFQRILKYVAEKGGFPENNE